MFLRKFIGLIRRVVNLLLLVLDRKLRLRCNIVPSTGFTVRGVLMVL